MATAAQDRDLWPWGGAGGLVGGEVRCRKMTKLRSWAQGTKHTKGGWGSRTALLLVRFGPFVLAQSWVNFIWLLYKMRISMSGHFGRSLSLFTNSKISNYLRSREFEDGGGCKATIGVVDLLRSNWVFNTGSKIEIDKSKSWTSWETMQSKHVTQLKIGKKLAITDFSHSFSPLENLDYKVNPSFVVFVSAPQRVVSSLSRVSWFSRVEQI